MRGTNAKQPKNKESRITHGAEDWFWKPQNKPLIDIPTMTKF